ncbi:hypothetical protein A3SI_03845 [Nitritalea halalkaliphila LW7]|uniref:DUF4249 domain-containing protein n=1 Tax=Nitritalea halalkaliphila LW7 TaxID=1189621 RepID=I5C975_9BACT|nr:DUF4249 family protein [Nitritalea halalkaliphila]EIM78377.1 hypothetical protein A3SI_03845 [Nitritalea halalkaliphila LW7]
MQKNIASWKGFRLLLLGLGLLALGFFPSCQEEVVLPLRPSETIPVIEAFWTDNIRLNRVSVSSSQDFFDADTAPQLSDARVRILDLTANREISFFYVEEANAFLPLDQEAGRIGHRYRLQVDWQEKRYESESVLLEPPILDSLAVNFRPQQGFRREGFYISVFGAIPFEENNNYRIRIVRNDTLLNRRSDILLFDDSFGTEILDRGFELNFRFRPQDRVRLELFRFERVVFDYFNQLVSLLFNDGGLFSPPPQNPVTNIRPVGHEGPVLGVFMVSPYLSAETVIIPGPGEPDVLD